MNDNIFLDKKQPVLLTQKQVAAYLNTTVDTLNVMRHKGTNPIPFLRWGRAIRYRKEDLDQWVQNNMQNQITTEATNA